MLHFALCIYIFGQVFVSPDYLCDDGRCKDETNMTRLLAIREKEAEAVNTQIDLVRSLLEICQEVPKHVKGRQC